MSQNSYLREFWAQVSQIVFLTDLTISTAYNYSMNKNCHQTHISAGSVHKCHKSCC